MKAITIPYAFSLRNLISEKHILASCDVIFVYDVDEAKQIISKADLEHDFQILSLEKPQKNILSKIAFECLARGMMEYLNLQTFQLKKKYRRVKHLNDLSNILLRKFFITFENSKIFRGLIEKLTFNDRKIIKKLNDLKIRELIVTSSHLRYEYSYLNAAKELDIPTTNIVSSWDVITTKGSYLYNSEKILVWGSANKEEIERIHQEILGRKNEIKIIGNPLKHASKNFDFKTMIHPTQRKILYTATVPRLFKNESKLIKKLCIYAKKNNYYLTIRSHPQADVQQYDHLEIEFPEVKFYQPGSQSKYAKDNVTFEKYFFKHYLQQIYESDIMIGVASTTALDAILLDKRYIFIAFDPSGEECSRINSYYYYEHYSKLLMVVGQKPVRSEDELYAEIERVGGSNYTKNVKKMYGLS